MPTRKPQTKSPWRHLVWILPLLVVDFFLSRSLSAGCARSGAPDKGSDAPAVAAPARPGGAAEAPAAPEPPPPPPPVWQDFHTPTPQQDLLHPEAPGVLQPTGSGRLVSAMFGSTRTGSINGRLAPRFHEGVDIAATARNNRGAPTDPIYAVADGRVAYVNTVAGNSSYGKYIVLEHPDPSLGLVTRANGSVVTSVVYTLYAHLADIRFGVRAGAAVRAGDEIATMGNTSNDRTGIPMARAHLHWEIGLMLNSRYDRLSREQKTANPMGLYNGLNLFGVDALDVWKAHMNDPAMTFGDYLAHLKPAMTLVLRGKNPDFFVRNPGLWHGAPYDGGPITVTLGESGIPLSGRNATPLELKLLGNTRQAVVEADESVLGRNARAYIQKSSSFKTGWIVTAKGRAWMDHLFF